MGGADLEGYQRFFRNLRKDVLGGILALVLFLAVSYMGIAAERGFYPFSGEEGGSRGGEVDPVRTPTANRDTPTQVPPPDDGARCQIDAPADGEIVGGSFEVAMEGCARLQALIAYVIVKDVFRYEADDVSPQYWLQCEVKVKESGDLVCPAFACVDSARYEVVVVVPRSSVAATEYGQWFDDFSNAGKEQLPEIEEIELIGGNVVVTADHSITLPPAVCLDLEPEIGTK